MSYPFEERLVATGSTSAQEDHDLAQAIEAYRVRSKPDDVQALQGFLSAHPHSAWSLALLTNIGLSDYHYGYFSRAIDDFQGAWTEGRAATAPPAKALADRALGELLRMHARLGHVEPLTTLLAETKDRGLTGSSNQMRDGAKEGLWLMRNQPGLAYLCGPMALKHLLHVNGVPADRIAFLNFYKSSPHGVTLAEVSHLADQAKLPHTLIYRRAGEPIPVPSVIHWKANHFAAIVGQQGDRFHIEDPTFGPGGSGLWVTRNAVDTEGSGYFLVSMTSNASASTPWRLISDDEAQHVYGMGNTTTSAPGNVTPNSPNAKTCPPTKGLCAYNFKEMLVSLNLTDTPVGYAPPKGPPVRIRVSYNQREEGQPANSTFFNVSPKWTLNVLSYIEDDPTIPGASVSRYVAGGGEINYTNYNGSTQAFAPDVQETSTLSIVSSNPIKYQRALPDGSIEIYSVSNNASSYPRLVFLTSVTDPAGNALTFNYDASLRLATIVDATGRITSFGYDGNSLLVSTITDPFKRTAKLNYNSGGQLTDITDVYGIDSHFGYDTSGLVSALTTPYGTTSFVYGDDGNQRYLQATDPLGYTERLEYYQAAPGISPNPDPSNLVPTGMVSLYNAYLYDRDTYYWDKHAYAVAGGNYTKARQRHWAHLTDSSGNWESITSDTIESEKPPLENRIWYNYPGQASLPLGAGQAGTYEQPTGIGRVLDDGTTQLTQTQYNASGNVTGVTDPVGRQTKIVYAANQTDVATVQQNTGSGFANVAQFPSYNSQHLPQSYVDAAGQTTQYAYYPDGQLHTVTDALGHTTTYNYNATNDLASIVDANGKTILSLAYDGFDRVQKGTDSQGWSVQYSYDALDRLTKETFPDSTTRIFTYKVLDLYQVQDRQKRVTTYTHDADRRLVAVQDPAGNLTKLGYYENGTLASLTDPNGHTTTWNRDLESRVTSKQYADGHGMGYGYEAATSRLLYAADQLNQIKQYTYTLDDRPARITFYNPVNPTPNVAFAYDPYFPRLASMTDGSGTTQYQYYNLGVLGALQLAQETPPFANATIAYSYDKVGRLSARSVGGDMEQFGYDAINRLNKHVDDLGSFTRTYLGETTQLMGQSNGTLGTTWSYYPNAQDRRLSGVATKGGNTYGLTWTDENDLTGLTDSKNNLSWTYMYDPADRLKTASTNTGLNYAYTYDPAGNLGPIQRPQGTTNVTSNSVNQVVAVNGVASTYDANGNLLKDYARTYAWDADNRLIAVGIIGQAGMQTNFRYDGFGRRIAIDTTSGGATSETRYQWCGETLCQARSSSDTVSRRYFDEGENALAQGEAFYYGVDQLGSVRDALTAPSGGVVAHYDYEPYGVQSNTALATTDFKYGRLFYNQQTGLYLGTYRPYDSFTGKWIQRDAIGERSDVNLYGYSGESPLSWEDSSGLAYQIVWTFSGTIIGGAAAGGAGVGGGLNLDGLNSSIYGFGQVTGGIGTGEFLGVGPGLSFGHGSAPTNGYQLSAYVEDDIAAENLSLQLSASEPLNCGGGVSESMAHPLPHLKKISTGEGAGSFAGTSQTYTLVSPSLSDTLEALKDLFTQPMSMSNYVPIYYPPTGYDQLGFPHH